MCCIWIQTEATALSSVPPRLPEVNKTSTFVQSVYHLNFCKQLQQYRKVKTVKCCSTVPHKIRASESVRVRERDFDKG